MYLQQPSIAGDDGKNDILPLLPSGGTREPLEGEYFFMDSTAWRILVSTRPG